MGEAENPLDGWSSLGNNMIWREDGAVVYPLFQPRHPRVEAVRKMAGAPPSPPKIGPWLARHPDGGFLGRFPTTEQAVRAVDSVHPLVSDALYRVPGRVQRLLDKLVGDPELVVGLALALAPIARGTVAPWERSASFGGSMIRKIAAPVVLVAIVSEELEDGPDPGYYRYPLRGAVRWRAWNERGTTWVKGAANDVHEAMDQADEALGRMPNLTLAPGRPTATAWKVHSGSSRARSVWSDPSHHTVRGGTLVIVRKVETKPPRWVWRGMASASRGGKVRDFPWRYGTRREAKADADQWLRYDGWELR